MTTQAFQALHSSALSPAAILARFPTWPSELPLDLLDGGDHATVIRESESTWKIEVVLMDSGRVYKRLAQMFEDDAGADCVFGALSALSPFAER